MPPTKKTDQVKVLAELKSIKDLLEKIISKTKAEPKMGEPDLGPGYTAPDTVTLPVEDTTTSNTMQYPIPQEYLNIVNELLSDKFRIEIKPDAELPQFEFILYVPKEYSNAPADVWKTHKQDKRPKVIKYGEGAGGVRTYVELVKANLGPDINAKIETDKQK